ncbi:DsbA family protein [bacterium]|nr:DsbA family protein [bacterium]
MSLKIAVNKLDHCRGRLLAPVAVVEYGDYQCPFCASAYPELEKVIEEFDSQLCFAYRHFPLRNIHPYAALAAMSAEAAGQQGQFWNMHRLLYENSAELSERRILECAEALELDMDRFATDLDQDELKEKVSEDFSGGVRSGVNGTPTLFLNGERFDGPPLYPALRSALVEILSETGPTSSTWR